MRCEFAAQHLGFGRIDADTGRAARRRHGDHVEGAAVSGHHSRQPAGEGPGLLVRAEDFVAGGAPEQFDPALHHFAAGLRLHRARVGRVHEDQLAGIVARPDRRRQCVDQHLQRGRVVDLLLVAQRQFREVVLDAGHLAQPQNCPAADDLALGFDQTAAQRGQRHVEAQAPRPQRVDRPLHLDRLVGREPNSKRQNAMRLIGVRQQRRIADNLRLV